MPRPRTSEPRAPELASLGLAIEALMRRGPESLTQTAVAHVSGLDVKLVNSYVRGQGNPTYRNLRRLARGLRVELSELMAAVEAIECGQDPEAAASAVVAATARERLTTVS